MPTTPDLVIIINIAAIIISPVVAVLVSLWLQGRSERRKTRLQVFSTLISNRHRPICEDNIRALHLIDTVFSGHINVRNLWHRYFDLVCSTDGQSPLGIQKREQVYRDMLVAMSRSLGYLKTIEAGDIERIYSPVGIGEADRVREQTASEFLRVLKGSEHFGKPNQKVALEGPIDQMEVKPVRTEATSAERVP